KDFPVFLHPDTHEEYALARTERKVGRGYRGFTVFTSPEVTLEEDLARRDLTINAIARDSDGLLIDPFGGCADLAARVLRHVSPAFAEDPVRILRVARFAARFGFAIAPETHALMHRMVVDGEADHLVAERVWQEIARGLMEARPSAMFAVLQETGALARVAPELAAGLSARQLEIIDRAASANALLPVRFALTVHGSTTASTLESLCDRLRVPTECRELGLLCLDGIDRVQRATTFDADGLADLLHSADALRRPHRFRDLVSAAALAAGLRPEAFPPARLLERALDAARGVDAAAIALDRSDPAPIPERLRAARVNAIAMVLRSGQVQS
ncbi:MAG: multifunctional CCA tRNA nucleotidyl transferase/2'3'-cyclic phosphodiesterase/2'nucleotidase/phosphatase, partial [Burkholderiales bacterium 12-64-5]